jgi:hypothetical protein
MTARVRLFALAAALALIFAARADDALTDAGTAGPPQQRKPDPPPAEQRVRVTVRAIAATREPQDPEVDARLSPIAADLKAFAGEFNYKAYRLVEEQTFDLDWKSPAQMELPGQRSLQVTPRALSSDGRIKVHLEVLGQHPEHARRLHTDYSVPRGRTILVGGYKLDPQRPDAGTLLIAVTQAVEK